MGDETGMSEAAWQAVLREVDRTYGELVAHQERLEEQNAALASAKRLIESVMDSVSDVLVVIDREGRVEEASASFRGLIPGDIAGRALADLVGEAAGARIGRAMEEMRLGRATEHFEIDIPTPRGPEPHEITLSARMDARGRLAGAVLMGRPLGALRAAYADLEESHEQLKEAQGQLVRNEKLASLGRLLAGVAHELNNPISFVYASVHALEKYVGQFETYFERVQAGASRAELVDLRQRLKLERNLRNLGQAVAGARDGAERVRDIVADLRRLSAEGPGEHVPFDLAETARVAAQWVERGSKCGITVGYDGPQNTTVSGVPGHVQQIVMNLVQNAIDAVQGTPDPKVGIEIETGGGLVRLTVRDNGPGVAEENLGRVFDPFFTTKPVGQGTGLGLSICAKIADEHGGRLTAGPGPGGAFVLELPAPEGGTP